MSVFQSARRRRLSVLASPPRKGKLRRSQMKRNLFAYVRSLDSRSRRVQLAAKRALDLVITMFALVIVLPMLLALTIAIRLESSGPAIYRQRRLGRNGRVFTMYKLRSMRDDCAVVLNPDGSTAVVEGDVRLTRLGKCMRSLGLDELPQLYNVLKGDMSLVGPRPDQDFHLKWYEPRDYRKLAMRPGITSLGQVAGRNSIAWKERMGWEIQYVETFSLWLDMKIILRTFGVVLRGIGAYNQQPEANKTAAIPSHQAVEFQMEPHE